MRRATDIRTLDYEALSPKEYMAELYIYMHDYGGQQGFAQAEIDAMYMTVWSEGGGQYAAKAKTSSAKGASQMTDDTGGTLKSRATAYADDLPEFHPYNQAVLTVDLARETIHNMPKSVDMGTIDPYQVNGMGLFKGQHKLGAGTYNKLLNAVAENPEMPLKEIVSKGALKANATIELEDGSGKKYTDWTAGEFIQWTNDIIGREDYMKAAVDSLGSVYPEATAEAIEAQLKASLSAKPKFNPYNAPQMSLRPRSPDDKEPKSIEPDTGTESEVQVAEHDRRENTPSPQDSQQKGWFSGLFASVENPQGGVQPALAAEKWAFMRDHGKAVPALMEGLDVEAIDRGMTVRSSVVAGIAVLKGDASHGKDMEVYTLAGLSPEAKEAALNCVRDQGGAKLGAVDSSIAHHGQGQVDMVMYLEQGFDPQDCSLDDESLAASAAGAKPDSAAKGRSG